MDIGRILVQFRWLVVFVVIVLLLLIVWAVYTGREVNIWPPRIGSVPQQETKVSDAGVPVNAKAPSNLTSKAPGEKPSQMTSEVLSNNSVENEILHDGTLHIRVLAGSEPVKFTGYWVSCAKDQQRVLFEEGALSKDVPIQDAPTATINCRLNDIRWLADAQTPPLVMPRHDLEINGKVIPPKYAKQTTELNANYIVRLKRRHL